MRLPPCDEIHYEAPPLKLAIAQIRFPAAMGGHHESAWAAFGHQLASEYPLHEEEAPPILPSGAQPPLSQTERIHRFTDHSKSWSVVLSDGALTLEAQTQGYSSSDELLRRFSHVLKAGHSKLNIHQRHRLGLRYINEIRHKDLSTLSSCTKHELLNEDLIGFAAKLSDNAEHMLQEVRFKESDGVFVVRHGLLRGSIAPPHAPNPEASPADPYYLLDLDYWDDRQMALDLEQTQKQLKDFSDLIYRFFRWTLGKRLEQEMKPIQRPGDIS
ncbi:TIGR04255 family protein [Hyalangium minutum]|nr:TIGR04255 family protein [Hyalangium minutum]